MMKQNKMEDASLPYQLTIGKEHSRVNRIVPRTVTETNTSWAWRKIVRTLVRSNLFLKISLNIQTYKHTIGKEEA